MSAFVTKLPSILAFLVSAMSIVAGGMVIRGWRPGYSILSWLSGPFIPVKADRGTPATTAIQS